MGTFIISRTSNGEYLFNLKSDNGEIVLTSERYVARGGCVNGVDAVQLNAQDSKRYKRRISDDGKYYFVLTAGNGQVVGVSELYETAQNCHEGVDAVMRAARGAEIYEKLG
ncbi:YegP family protein [Chitinophaga lutea]